MSATRDTVSVELAPGGIAVVTMNRPARSNAIDDAMWEDLRATFRELEVDEDVRCCIIRGEGRNFNAGIDVTSVEGVFGMLGDDAYAPSTSRGGACEGRRRERVLARIERLQDVFTALERIRVPVIAAVRGACYGAGVDLITACDIRLCASDARFCVKEVDLGITADVGTLQRLPSIVGHGAAMDLCLTARVISGEEAKRIGLVSDVCDDVDARAMALARTLAEKSPLAVRGTKRVLLRQRDNPSVRDGLHYVATHNAAVLISNDLHESVAARFEKRPPIYAKL